MKLYGFIYSVDPEETFVYFPSLGKFGLIAQGKFRKHEIIELDKENDEITNPVKCEQIEISYGEIFELNDDCYKIKSDVGLTYSIPLNFFLPTQDLIQKGMKVKLYKNNVGVLVYGEVYAPPKPQENSEDLYPETIGPKLQLNSMKNLFKHNKTIQKSIDCLEATYSSWRKIRGDGNCYYRAIGLGYIEHLCRESTDSRLFFNFLNKCSTEFKSILKYLYQIKLRLGSAVSYCSEVFLNTKNDEFLVTEMKNYIADYVQKHSERFLPYLTHSIEAELEAIKEMGREAEGIVCNYIGEILGINVTSVILDRDQLSNHKIEVNTEGGIYLCLRGGHYDLLYTYEQDIQDVFGNIQIPNRNLYDYLEYLHSHIRFLYESLFKLSFSYNIRINQYFPEFSEVVAGYWNLFPMFMDNGDEISKSCEKLYDFVSQKTIISEVLGLCAYCELKKSDFRLNCGHLYCKDDAKDIINNQSNGVYPLKLAGLNKFKCVMCDTTLCDQDIKNILGDEHIQSKKNSKSSEKLEIIKKPQPKILESPKKAKKFELSPGTVQCQSCGSNESESKFPHKCLCKTCLKKIRTESCPFCGQSLAKPSTSPAAAKCSKCKDTITKESIISHSNHVLCEKCEESCLEFDCCTICKEPLTKSEKQKLSIKYYQMCFNCQSHFPSISISIRKCDCLLCDNCFSQSLEFNSSCCLLCGEKLIPTKKVCEICTESFLREEMITLTCDHYYCNKCLQQHFISQINSGTVILKCPSCGEVIDGNIIQSIVSPSLWDAFNKTSIRKNFKLADCPRCGAYFETSVKKAKCSDCKYQFCVLCKDKGHDGNCNDNKIKAIILEIEGKGERVAQCPGCKYPYTKDEGCEHVTCSNPQCGIEFCFTCSCVRSPTLSHGNHYHREDCKFYSEFHGQDKENKDCTECKKLKKLCPRPKKLQNPRRFEVNEC
jgi:uncharacterized C2H2 Zn-finger protein